MIFVIGVGIVVEFIGDIGICFDCCYFFVIVVWFVFVMWVLGIVGCDLVGMCVLCFV